MLVLKIQRGFLGLSKKIFSYAALLNCPARSQEQRGIKYVFNPLLPGGGLEKMQGCMSEERYFNLKDFKLIVKIREKLMGEDTTKCDTIAIQDLPAKEGDAANCIRRETHESCSMNKHKICMEELFFMNQETENLRYLQQKKRKESESQPNVSGTI